MEFQNAILRKPSLFIEKILGTENSLKELGVVGSKFREALKNHLEKKERFGCYTDTGNCQADEEIDFGSPINVTCERQTYYCVPVPGENQWVKDIYLKNSKAATEMHSYHEAPKSKSKRCLEEDNDESSAMEATPSVISATHKGSEEKKMKDDGAETNNSYEKKKPPEKLKTDFTKNFPLPDEKGSSCFVTMYSNPQELKLNDVAEFLCVLSVDPEFASKTMEPEKMETSIPMWHGVNSTEEEAHCPPPSLVPRLHCIYFNKMPNNIHQHINEESYTNASNELSSIRADLIQLLTRIFGGDSVVAEYFLLHLISKVYGRLSAMCVGKMSLNITKCPSENFTRALYQLISLITEKSYFLPMTLENLNGRKFIPSKDYEANRLVSGILQLSEGTHLVLDETQMQPGQLDTEGVKNITALGNVIQWQKVEYDFKFNKVEMNTDVNVLVLSEGKSLLTCDCRIPIVSEEIGSTHPTGVVAGLSSKLLDRLRMYLSIVRNMEYDLTDEVQRALEEDFVEMRKEDPKSTNADSFYLLLTTARYMALSYGQSTLSAPLWTRTKELDRERRIRLSS